MIPVKFKKIHPDAKLPKRATGGASCYDIYAVENTSFEENETIVIKAGFAVGLPEGYEMLIRGRSGLSKEGIMVHTGVVDSDFCGEVGVIITNLSNYPFGFRKGDRMAQLKLAKTPTILWEEVDTLEATERGNNGYGSTGR